jgi:DNA-binding protein YbaB
MSDEYTALNELLSRYGRSSEDGAPKKIADAVNRLSARFADLMVATAEGADPSGYVRATVKLSGRVESVYIRPQAIRDLPGSALDQACLEAIAAARKAGTAAFTARLEELTGQRLDLDHT